MPAPRNKVRAYQNAVGRGSARIATVDFETYHDADYSLRKLSTSEYIRDPRFESVCVAVRVGDDAPMFAGGPAEVEKLLRSLDWRNLDLLAHHAHFEGLILSHHYAIVPRYYRDTLSMARGLHAKFERNDLGSVAIRYNLENKLEMPDFKGKRWDDLTDAEKGAVKLYNLRDLDVCAGAYQIMVAKIPADEMDVIHHTVQMFAAPVLRLDMKLAKQELAREIKEREEAISTSGAAATYRPEGPQVKRVLKSGVKVMEKPVSDEDVLSSNKMFPEALRAVGVEPPMKISKTTHKPTYALAKADEEFTDLIAHPDPRVVALVKGRLAAKSTIGETRAARLITSGSGGKRLPVYLNYCGAHTTRWSGGDKLNYQNLKKKGELRKAIMAPPGFVIVDIDSKTIEARVLAWLADEAWLLEAFRQGHDPYVLFAEDIYGRKIDPRIDKLERFISKSCVLGLGYQMGGPKLQVSILAGSIAQGLAPVRLDLDMCYGLVNKYRAKNRKIKELWEFMHTEVVPELAEGHKPREYKGILYGKEFVQLKGHLALHYPEAAVKWVGGKKNAPRSGWVRARLKKGETQRTARVDEGSYRTPLGRSKLYGGLMTENWVQYLARMVVSEQMLKIADKYRVVMTNHDAVVFLAPEKSAQKALDWGMQIMKTSPAWAPDLPIDAEGGFDKVYSK